MILKSLLINNFGPFAVPTKISFENTTTILTGQNDVGKSSILRLLNILGGDQTIEENDVNTYHIHEANMPWQDDDSIYCEATYIITNNFVKYFKTAAANFGPGWEVTVKFYLAPNKKRREVIKAKTEAGKKVDVNNFNLRAIPSALLLPGSRSLNSIVDTMIGYKDELGKAALTLAFGENYSNKLSGLGGINLTRETRLAAERLSKLTASIFPPSLKMQFVFDKLIENEGNLNKKFIIGLRDDNDCDTVLQLRGAGVQKIINLAIEILYSVPHEENFIILIDEPENSLHSNAQHSLRLFLEELSTSPNLQIIYATHSPSMIDVLSPERIRLFERTNKDDKPTTIINNKPIEDNFYPVRTSLGISPADSLLYAPITIVVEGETEILGLPLLLKRLHNEKIAGFELAHRALSVSHFLDGHGSSFEYWCRIAKSQGCKPIIFVDGDKSREIQQQKISEKHPDVPIIILETMSEFEEIVPKSIYFQSLASELENSQITEDAFNQWETQRKIISKVAFTKRIDWWLSEEFSDVIYSKPRIMKKAIETADLSSINTTSIKQLVDKMVETIKSI